MLFFVNWHKLTWVCELRLSSLTAARYTGRSASSLLLWSTEATRGSSWHTWRDLMNGRSGSSLCNCCHAQSFPPRSRRIVPNAALTASLCGRRLSARCRRYSAAVHNFHSAKCANMIRLCLFVVTLHTNAQETHKARAVRGAASKLLNMCPRTSLRTL